MTLSDTLMSILGAVLAFALGCITTWLFMRYGDGHKPLHMKVYEDCCCEWVPDGRHFLRLANVDLTCTTHGDRRKPDARR